MSIPPHLETIFFGLGPVFAIAGLVLVWAKLTRVPRLRRLFRWSALCWPIVLCTVLGLAALAGKTCRGNALYGFGQCTLFSDAFSNSTTGILIIAYLLAIIYTALVVIYAIYKEIQAVPQS